MMKLCIRKANLLDRCILWILLLNVMIFTWLGLSFISNKILMLLFFVKIIITNKIFAQKSGLAWYFVIFCYFLFSKISHGGDISVLFSNLTRISVSIFILIYLSHLMVYEREFLYEFFKRLFIPLNIYILLNIPVIILQLNGMTWLAGVSDAVNTLDMDLISGLFGFNGTPMLTMYSAFLIIYNYHYAREWAIPKKGPVILIYDAFLIIFFSILSIFNGNNGFYIVLIMEIILYYITVVEAVDRKKKFLIKCFNLIKKLLPRLVVLCLLIFIAYETTDIKVAVDYIINVFQDGLEATDYNIVASGSSERIAMIVYALSSPVLIVSGYGLAKYLWQEESAFGFWHYGQNDVGTFLCLGGMVFMALICTMVFLPFRKIFQKSYLSIMFTMMIIAMAVYTQVFTNVSSMISIMMYITICWCVREGT